MRRYKYHELDQCLVTEDGTRCIKGCCHYKPEIKSLVAQANLCIDAIAACKAALCVHDVYSTPDTPRLLPEVVDKLRAAIALAAPAPAGKGDAVVADEQKALMQVALGDAMSSFSEDAYCAGWISGLEDDLPRLCEAAIRTGESQRFGQEYLNVENAVRFKALAELAGTWVAFCSEPGKKYEPYEPKVKP